MSHIDSTRLTAEEMPEPMQQRARLTVCRNARSAEEAREFMAMLGITPITQEEAPRKAKDWVLVPANRARDRIIDLRALKLTWTKIADATGVSATTLRNILEGRATSVTEDTEQAILDVTGIGKAGAA